MKSKSKTPKNFSICAKLPQTDYNVRNILTSLKTNKKTARQDIFIGRLQKLPGSTERRWINERQSISSPEAI